MKGLRFSDLRTRRISERKHQKWFVCILINKTCYYSLKPMPSPGPTHGEREPFHTPTCHLELDWQGIRAACDISKTKMSQPRGSGVQMVTCITVCFNWLHRLLLFFYLESPSIWQKWLYKKLTFAMVVEGKRLLLCTLREQIALLALEGRGLHTVRVAIKPTDRKF